MNEMSADEEVDDAYERQRMEVRQKSIISFTRSLLASDREALARKLEISLCHNLPATPRKTFNFNRKSNPLPNCRYQASNFRACTPAL
ncbi:predicted protein [Botrytis cinerea T4]|uniref:Uncharacterized protein n=1 Tax=Botryotinia fuckeliana (strain T4) TaxID=999810 RepID=G2Y889_BOTF4|nr:predicted protein [Botrytis cinerea T4]